MRPVSLERQVRIFLGVLVVAASVAACLHPWGLGLTAFLGASLIFSGVADYCGTSRILARMPWNR